MRDLLPRPGGKASIIEADEPSWHRPSSKRSQVTDVRVVAKAMDDLADDWHWVLLIGAVELEPRVFHTTLVKTRCGLSISSVPRVVQLFDMGAPEHPTCPRCLDGEIDPGLRAAISEVIESSERAPVSSRGGR